MNADVEKAVKSMHRNPCVLQGDLRVIEQALRDQDAEMAWLRDRERNICDALPSLSDGGRYRADIISAIEGAFDRAEKTDALLRECRRFVAWASERLPEAMPTYEKLDAHLGGEQ